MSRPVSDDISSCANVVFSLIVLSRSDLNCICSSPTFVSSAMSCVLTNCPDEEQVAQQLLTTECQSGEFLEFICSLFVFGFFVRLSLLRFSFPSFSRCIGSFVQETTPCITLSFFRLWSLSLGCKWAFTDHSTRRDACDDGMGPAMIVKSLNLNEMR